MLNLLVGVGIGYIAFTENGRKMGNRVADMATSRIKKVVEDVKAATTDAASDAKGKSKPSEPARHPDSAD